VVLPDTHDVYELVGGVGVVARVEGEGLLQPRQVFRCFRHQCRS
jgi:hypothetical protein